MLGIFLDEMSIHASKAVHIGDDEKADKEGANAVGIDCWWVYFLANTSVYVNFLMYLFIA